ncbi:MAG TPA: Fic family protein [Chlamydiales bacterium]|nr:Fic family protein [Chlamydiales bacterium]
MAPLRPSIPDPLPIKDLDWASLVPLIGEAREALARFDERLKHISSLADRRWQESVSSVGIRNTEKIVYAHKALEFAIRWAKRKPLSLDFLCRVHAIVKQDASNPSEIGRLRTLQNWIGPHGCPIEEAYFYPPRPKKVRLYMQELYRYMRSREKDPLVQLAIFFGQILIIHPFMDGNGRVARIFVPVWLWKKGLISQPALFLSSYFEQNRTEYFKKLFLISEKGAWEDWIAYFLKGVIQQSLLIH